MKPPKRNPRKAAGRERLLATAHDLFLQHGAANVGINDVTEIAGVARMTLYNNFPSKEALILAVYTDLAETTLRELQDLDRTQLPEEGRILAVFDHLGSKTHAADYRGCPFIHASVQAAEPSGPIYTLVHAYKRSLRDHVLGLLDQRRGDQADLADQIVILLDGAVTEAYLKGVAHPMTMAKRAAVVLLQAARSRGGT